MLDDWTQITLEIENLKAEIVTLKERIEVLENGI
jgi:hypothetical protein